MRLADLNPEWVTYSDEGWKGTTPNFSDAQGIIFDDPIRHSCICIPFKGRNVPTNINSGIQWKIASGTSFEDLTLTPSVDASKSGGWHGFITNGQIITC